MKHKVALEFYVNRVVTVEPRKMIVRKTRYGTWGIWWPSGASYCDYSTFQQAIRTAASVME